MHAKYGLYRNGNQPNPTQPNPTQPTNQPTTLSRVQLEKLNSSSPSQEAALTLQNPKFHPGLQSRPPLSQVNPVPAFLHPFIFL